MTNIPETGRTPRVQIRLVVIQILVFSLLGTLGGRLWYLQIRNGDEYAKEASGNHVQQVVQPAVRGSILDARGVPIADNETRLVVSASRTDLLKMKDDGKAVLTKLAGVLDLKPEDVIEKVRLCDAKTPQPCWNGSPYQPIPITDEATAKQALQIRERSEDFPGITAEPEAVRRYAAPGEANTAQVLGYLSPVTDNELQQAKDSDSPYLRSDQVGRSGLERQYDKELRGKAGVTRYEVDNLGRVIGKAKSDAAEPGSNLVTSIDARVQRVAEYELNDAMKVARTQFDKNTNENYKADSGAVVVMEAKTGRVVAMASNPTYDPNAWVGGISAKDYARLTGKKSNYPLLNRAIQGQSAPGSTFKVISTAAAVEAGYDFNGHYPCTSSYSIGSQVFKNFESENFGPISLGRALEVSCDTVFYGLAHNEWKRDGASTPRRRRTTGSSRPPTSSASARRPASTSPTRSPAVSPTASGSRATGRPTRTPGASPARRTATTSRRSRTRTASKATRCAPVTRSTTPSVRATRSSLPSRWPRSTGRSPTAAPCTTPPSARRSSAPTVRTCGRSSRSRTASCP
ncbi:hypothetical protein SAV31267_036570 [Streptomyces avermitilis]|uniref:Penicillin-binding protein 2 n=1 Tax=Streptomyces avermitilis TaxID=33903 RepID=A0A4D4MPT4_STRAX|nr:hypothetical protein SAV31267_036570 [Streptomyces avermitilis]